MRDINYYTDEGNVTVDLTDPDGISIYEVPVLHGHEQAVLALLKGRQPEELVFPRLPHPLFLQHYRLQYARALYREVCEDNPMGYDEEDIVSLIMHALGYEHRMEVVRRYYLGLPPAAER